MEPPSKDDPADPAAKSPANPYGVKKAWGNQAQGAFRIGQAPRVGAQPIRMPAPPPDTNPQPVPAPRPTSERPSSILTGSPAAPQPRTPAAAPVQPVRSPPPRPTQATIRPESMPMGVAGRKPRPASRPRSTPAPATAAPPRSEAPALAAPTGVRPMLTPEALAALGASGEGRATAPVVEMVSRLRGRLPLLAAAAVLTLVVAAGAAWVLTRPATVDSPSPAVADAAPPPAPATTSASAPPTPIEDLDPVLTSPLAIAPPATPPPSALPTVTPPVLRATPPAAQPAAAAPPPVIAAPPPPLEIPPPVVAAPPPAPRPAPPPVVRPPVDPDGPMTTRLPEGN